jgi:NitT/TauT family transport system substrate-binding protein
MNYNPAPQGLMKTAEHMHRIGTLKSVPAAWTDTFLHMARELPGN